MLWVCPHDRSRLEEQPNTLSCSQCGRTYALVDSIPVFANGDAEADASLSELWQLIERSGMEEASRRFTAKHALSPSPSGSDWKLFLPLHREGLVVELGAGFGDGTLDLSAATAQVVALVPDATNARILHRRLTESQRTNVATAVLNDLARLPLPEHSCDAIVMESAAANSFGVSDRNFPDVATEWKRLLIPQGTVLLSLANPLYNMPGARSLHSTLRARSHPRTLNRFVKAPTESTDLALTRVVRELTHSGFSQPEWFAPLPDETKPDAVVPLRDRAPLHHFLHNMIRQETAATRIAAAAAKVLVTLNLFRYVVPHYFLRFRAP